MTPPEGLAPANGYVVFVNVRHDAGVLPRPQGFRHVVCLIQDSHSPGRGLYLHYACRAGLWRPKVLETALACRVADGTDKGEVYTLPDAIRAAMIDLDLNGNPDAAATVLPWRFPDRPAWRPWFAWRRTATGQAKHLMGVKAALVRTPAGLHAWITTPAAERRTTPWTFARGLFWLTWQMASWLLQPQVKQGAK